MPNYALGQIQFLLTTLPGNIPKIYGVRYVYIFANFIKIRWKLIDKNSTQKRFSQFTIRKKPFMCVLMRKNCLLIRRKFIQIPRLVSWKFINNKISYISCWKLWTRMLGPFLETTYSSIRQLSIEEVEIRTVSALSSDRNYSS